VLFKTPNQDLEFVALHPIVRTLIQNLDVWSKAQGLPEVCVTEVLRTIKQQEEIYYKQMMRDFTCTEEVARMKARNKDSWHLWLTAIDLRVTQYTAAQRKAVIAQLKGEMDKISKAPRFFEFITEKHGTGEHIHLARRDVRWKERYNKKDATFPLIKAGVTTHVKGAPQV
jgi:hypothetical protein